MAETKGGGFICPNCKRRVIGMTVDSRVTLYGRRRRKICEACGKRFTTVEYLVGSDMNGLNGGIENANKKA